MKRLKIKKRLITDEKLKPELQVPQQMETVFKIMDKNRMKGKKLYNKYIDIKNKEKYAFRGNNNTF